MYAHATPPSSRTNYAHTHQERAKPLLEKASFFKPFPQDSAERRRSLHLFKSPTASATKKKIMMAATQQQGRQGGSSKKTNANNIVEKGSQKDLEEPLPQQQQQQQQVEEKQVEKEEEEGGEHVVKFEDFLRVYRTLPLLHVPIQHDIQVWPIDFVLDMVMKEDIDRLTDLF